MDELETKMDMLLEAFQGLKKSTPAQDLGKTRELLKSLVILKDTMIIEADEMKKVIKERDELKKENEEMKEEKERLEYRILHLQRNLTARLEKEHFE
ncbi:hypothetical protein ADUPG1_013742 [Aduncisulcus paluster]|uniref:Uncharacterized protein n=1 Tax=Aduncisulcus paluster TaxID=2918883 RepID=A0ABQ5K616_9EUKA|nr:hypothetical protein ADUPG1_013742 [Aduncisulcus paluster]